MSPEFFQHRQEGAPSREPSDSGTPVARPLGGLPAAIALAEGEVRHPHDVVCSGRSAFSVDHEGMLTAPTCSAPA